MRDGFASLERKRELGRTYNPRLRFRPRQPLASTADWRICVCAGDCADCADYAPAEPLRAEFQRMAARSLVGTRAIRADMALLPA